ncbi:MAG: hypothetical protein CMC13_02530 [Flavobacteriaceae bacterium]|nr:hypothetical protein [Flavobacteriaceae bacterium]
MGPKKGPTSYNKKVNFQYFYFLIFSVRRFFLILRCLLDNRTASRHEINNPIPATKQTNRIAAAPGNSIPENPTAKVIIVISKKCIV